MKNLILLLLPILTFAQKHPVTLSPDRVEIIYDGLKKGEQCESDLDAANELIAKQSARIIQMANEAKETAAYLEAKLLENSILEKRILEGSVKVAKYEASKPFGVGLYAGYGFSVIDTTVRQSPSIGVGVVWSPKFLRFRL